MKQLPFLVMLAALLVAPFVVYPLFLANALCLALFACAFNLLAGYSGLLSFGHAAFLGTAGYITAYTTKSWGYSPELGILAGVAASTLLGAFFGFLAIRRQGLYFAMVTLALAQMVYFVCLQAPFTGGENGIQPVPRGRLFGLIDLSPNLTMYYFALAIFLIGYGIIYRTIHSPYGRVLKAISENEPRALSLGYRVDQYKLLAFTLSAALSGLAGSTKVLVYQLASLADVSFGTSGEVLLMVLIGGLGTVIGPVIGAFIVATMVNYLAQYGSWVTVIQGVIFVVCVLIFRRGVAGEAAALLRRWQARGAVAKPAPGE